MTEFWADFPGLVEELDRVSAAMAEAVGSENSVIRDATATLVGGDGKLLRPGLLIVASRFGKIDGKKRASLAAALEMLHVATLVHDDVIDDSPLRRGLPAAHVRFGKKDAVLIGDYLLSRCFLLAAAYTSPDNAIRLARAISVICTMEIEQDMDRFRADPSVRRYLRKIMGKTALLFSLACHVGAVEAKAPPLVAERLRRAGYDIGMAFQIIDDILDYEGTADLVRKPVGNDLRAGLATLPLLCALQNDHDGGLAALVSVDRFATAEPAEIIRATEERGGIEGARAYARRYTERSLAEIGKLPRGEPRNMMERLARKLLERTY
jgi:heptaprenyl diphosphate synthase